MNVKQPAVTVGLALKMEKAQDGLAMSNNGSGLCKIAQHPKDKRSTPSKGKQAVELATSKAILHRPGYSVSVDESCKLVRGKKPG